MFDPCVECKYYHNIAFCSQKCQYGKCKTEMRLQENRSNILFALLSDSAKDKNDYDKVIDELQEVIKDDKHKPDIAKIYLAINAAKKAKKMSTPYTVEELKQMGNDAINLWGNSQPAQKIRVESTYTEDVILFSEVFTDTPPAGYYEIQPRTDENAEKSLLCKYTGLENSIGLLYDTYGRTWNAYPA